MKLLDLYLIVKRYTDVTCKKKEDYYSCLYELVLQVFHEVKITPTHLFTLFTRLHLR